jgi:hypothetical protein
MHATTPIDAVPTTRRHLNTEPLRTIHARALVLAHTSGEPIEAARRALALGLLILRAQRREEPAPVDGSDHPVTCQRRCCR